MTIKVCSVFGEEFLPTRGTDKSAGWDIRTPIDIIMPPDSVKVVDTGIIIDGAEDRRSLMYLLVPRSSAGIRYGLSLQNTVGIVDQDYAGPEDTIKAALYRRPVPKWVCEGPKEKKDLGCYHTMFHGEAFRDISLDERQQGDWARWKLYEAGDRFLQLIVMEYVNEVWTPVEGVQTTSNRGMNSTGVE